MPPPNHDTRERLGPPSLALIGHLPQYAKDPLGFFEACVAEYGDVVRLRIGKSTLLLSNPVDIDHVTVKAAAKYDRSPRLAGTRESARLGGGLLTLSSGPRHLERRRTLQPLFSQSAIRQYEGAIRSSTQRSLATWVPGATIDIAAEMKTLARRAMIKMVFGLDHPLENELNDAVAARRRHYEHLLGSLFPFPEWVPKRSSRDYSVAMRLIDREIEIAILTRQELDGAPSDLLAHLVALARASDSALTLDQVRGEVLTVFDSGYETIAAALAWMFFCLAQDPAVTRQLLGEWRQAKDRPLNAATVEDLDLTGRVVAETLRLYPPTWMFVRVAQQADRLPGGVEVPAGTKLYLCPYLAHRNEKFFPDPLRFDPERFTRSAAPRPRLAYFPFGHGVHKCIGEHFAKLQVSIVLIETLRRFELELVPNQDVVAKPGLALRPGAGISMRVRRRSESTVPTDRVPPQAAEG